MGQSQSNQEQKRLEANKLAELMKPKRITQFDEQLLKSVFSDQPEPYRALRNLFYGFDLDPIDEQTIGLLRKPEVNKVIRKIFLPQITKDIAFSQAFDLWQDIQQLSPESFDVMYDVKEYQIELLTAALSRIDDPTVTVDISPKREIAKLVGRNGYLAFVDKQIGMLMVICAPKQLTPEEAIMRLRQDSVK